MMKCTSKGVKHNLQVWTGCCRNCKAEFEATREELNVSCCPRENYEFAHAECTECGAKSGRAVILYPKIK